MTDKKPTDAAIIKAFQKFEEAMNVWMAEYRHSPVEEQNFIGFRHMWEAHDAFRRSALAAQERIDAKKKESV